jgi:preprotein translocase subunit YajC
MVRALIGPIAVLAAEAGGTSAGQQQPSLIEGIMPFVPIVLIFVLFIWFMNRSQKKRQRERQEMLDSLRPRDDVYTVGGIKGRIVRIDEDDIVLRVDQDKDIKITVSRGGIGRKAGEEPRE